MSKIDWEKISLAIITKAGEAKSFAMEGIFAAKKDDFVLARQKLVRANAEMAEASHQHFAVIQAEAQGEQLEYKVLFLHAEDQLLSTQTLLLLAQEIVDLHHKIKQIHDS